MIYLQAVNVMKTTLEHAVDIAVATVQVSQDAMIFCLHRLGRETEYPIGDALHV